MAEAWLNSSGCVRQLLQGVAWWRLVGGVLLSGWKNGPPGGRPMHQRLGFCFDNDSKWLTVCSPNLLSGFFVGDGHSVNHYLVGLGFVNDACDHCLIPCRKDPSNIGLIPGCGLPEVRLTLPLLLPKWIRTSLCSNLTGFPKATKTWTSWSLFLLHFVFLCSTLFLYPRFLRSQLRTDFVVLVYSL
jgi:hypothetical protein